jgi:hypothetical protein
LIEKPPVPLARLVAVQPVLPFSKSPFAKTLLGVGVELWIMVSVDVYVTAVPGAVTVVIVEDGKTIADDTTVVTVPDTAIVVDVTFTV